MSELASLAASAGTADKKAVLAATDDVIQAIMQGDWDKYSKMCAKDMTCFEPEAQGCLVKGLAFHKFYFDNGMLTPLGIPFLPLIRQSSVMDH